MNVGSRSSGDLQRVGFINYKSLKISGQFLDTGLTSDRLKSGRLIAWHLRGDFVLAHGLLKYSRSFSLTEILPRTTDLKGESTPCHWTM
jgi:hypothetical protein